MILSKKIKPNWKIPSKKVINSKFKSKNTIFIELIKRFELKILCYDLEITLKRYKTYCKNKINENVRRKTDRGSQNPISQNH